MAKGSTALQEAARIDDFHICRLLLEHGASVDQPRADGLTALIAAAQEGHVQCVRLLLKHGASTKAIQAPGYTALSSAVYHGHLHTMKIIVEHKRSSLRLGGANSGTLLHVAVQSFRDRAGDYRTVPIVKQLLLYGVSPLEQDENSETPLAMLERVSAEIPDAFLRNVWAMQKLLKDAMKDSLAKCATAPDPEAQTEDSK